MRRTSHAPFPTVWLFTDERLGGADPADPLWRAVARLPRGGGIVLRHYAWPEPARRELLRTLTAVARRRRLLLVGSRISGAPGGVHRPSHGRRARGRGLVTAAAHSRRELVEAFAARADLVFLSPVFATGSHPGVKPLGPLRFGLAARRARGPVMALGGMDAGTARRLAPLGAAGFAAISAFLSPESRARAAGR
jgi:thiamine-phosphate pyrophosphorylase